MENYVKLLKNTIKDVVNELSCDKGEQGKGKYKGIVVAGKNCSYHFSEFTVFETTIVESILKKILQTKNDDNLKLGWEVSYPNPKWGRSKLDLALDFIEGSEYLFRIAIEVKKMMTEDFHEKEMVPYNIWNDIFKISGYTDETYRDTGKYKFVLVFFEKPVEYDEQKLEDIFTKAFVTHKDFNQHIEKIIRNKKPELNNIYEFFLKTKIGWKSCVDEALEYLGLGNGDRDIKFVDFEKIDGKSYYLKNNIGALLLRVITV